MPQFMLTSGLTFGLGFGLTFRLTFRLGFGLTFGLTFRLGFGLTFMAAYIHTKTIIFQQCSGVASDLVLGQVTGLKTLY